MKYVIGADGWDEEHQIAIVELSTPYNVVNNAPCPITVKGYPNQDGNNGVPADTVKFPELKDMLIQKSDPHMLIIDTGSHQLYELYNAKKTGEHYWMHQGAAVFDLKQDSLRTMAYEGYTSADAAGLPILPTLIRYDELKRGVINHPLRMTFRASQVYQAHTYPALHHSSGVFYDSVKAKHYLPLGARLRLKANVKPERFRGVQKTIVVCLRTYGVIVADISPVPLPLPQP